MVHVVNSTVLVLEGRFFKQCIAFSRINLKYHIWKIAFDFNGSRNEADTCKRDNISESC